MNYGPELVTALTYELKEYCGRQLQKIDGGGNWCTFGFKGRGTLFFTWNPQTFGICSLSSDDAREMRATSTKTPFLQSLQKHLIGSSLYSVSHIEGDRVLMFGFRKFVGGGQARETRLILELTGRMSNAILTDDAGAIIEAAHHVYPDVNRYRSIIPGSLYVSPPPMAGTAPKPDMNRAELIDALKKPKGVGRVLANVLCGMLEDGYESHVRNALFTERRIYQTIGSYLTCAGEELPGVTVYDGYGLDFCRDYIAGEIRKRSLKNIAERAKKLLDRTIRAKARHIDGLKSQIEKGEHCDRYRIAGEAILQNLGRIKEHQDSALLKYWDADGEKEIRVALNPLIGAQANAKNYFKKYQKFRTDVNEIRPRLKALEDDLEDMRSLMGNLDRVYSAEKLTALCDQIAQQYDTKAKSKPQSRKQKKPLPPHLRFTVGESLILVGMNERGNRYVTFQEAAPDDLWFHVHERPGAHVILKNAPEDNYDLQKCVRAAASLALLYSECDAPQSVIDYTYKKHVRHIQGSGPANVTYKFPSTILVSPDDWKEIIHSR